MPLKIFGFIFFYLKFQTVDWQTSWDEQCGLRFYMTDGHKSNRQLIQK